MQQASWRPPCHAEPLAWMMKALYSVHAGRTFQSLTGQAACAPCPKGGTLSADHRRCSECARQTNALELTVLQAAALGH